MRLDFAKMHGLGNDFVVIDNRNGRVRGEYGDVGDATDIQDDPLALLMPVDMQAAKKAARKVARKRRPSKKTAAKKAAKAKKVAQNTPRKTASVRKKTARKRTARKTDPDSEGKSG